MDEPLTLSLTLPRVWALGLLTMIGIGIMSWLIYLTLPEGRGEKGRLHKLRASLGLGRIPPVAMLVGLIIYLTLVGILLLGLLGMIIATLEAFGRTSDQLFYVLRIGGLTAVLGAVIAFPLTLVRLGLARESLLNDKIGEATKGLYARRQVTKAVVPSGSYKLHQDFWEDDVVQRNAAIDRLEGLAYENTKEIARIASLLSVYVREIGSVLPARELPTGAPLKKIANWAESLPKLRSDLEKAAQTLGRLPEATQVSLTNGAIDLRGANLQTADLRSVNWQQVWLQKSHLDKANLQNAKLQGALLRSANLRLAGLGEAKLQRADLRQTQLQGARLGHAQLQKAHLGGANLCGTFLGSAQLQGAYLGKVQLDHETDLTSSLTLGAATRATDYRNVLLSREQIEAMFGDASITLPNGVTPDHEDWPEHWPKEVLDPTSFRKRWKTWQTTLPED
ncbi:hypothetical protein GCM10007385_15390 [Tateyamaria omphalii]|uniref:pentapeptide repeat-containing protein n=1 Tax=Tateyamaria omphalii TaxID=299262 RepID=UPI00167ADC71|nr:pentapeptide repeat-containing protein [Tateyamaria omphalii]GGX48395.1 hypothetical protein GCM10007385_15390 [Tateyamaria omphalii]